MNCHSQNITTLHPCLSAMVSPLPGAQNCQLQPVGISNQELESLLAKPAKELPAQVFRELGNKLQPMTFGVCTGDWIHVAELLGFSREQIENLEAWSKSKHEPPGFLMLMEWCKHEYSSSLFILRDTLWSCGRHDCVSLLDGKIEDIMFMHLYLRIIDNSHPSSQMRLLKVRTKCDATIRESLQNLLGGDSDDSEYELVDTPLLSKAKRFKGKQITLRKKNRTQSDILPLNITSSESSNSNNSTTDSNITTPMYLPQTHDTPTYHPQTQDTSTYHPQTQDTSMYHPQTQDTSMYHPQTQDTSTYHPQTQDTSTYHPQTQDTDSTVRLNETNPCRLDESNVQANPPRTCVGTIRKINYITEDCVQCGKIRTMSQRHVRETSSTIRTDTRCPYCNRSSSTVTQPPFAQIDTRISYQQLVSDTQEIPPTVKDASPCHRVHLCSSDSGDTEVTFVKQLHRGEESLSKGKTNTNSYTQLPSAPPSSSGVQKYPNNYQENAVIPMTQIKRQRSVSEPPDLLVADLESKFDQSMTTSSSFEIPKRSKKRKVELSYQEICEILRNFPGWDPSETENKVEQSMTRYCKEDGNYVVWYMREAHRLVVTVSHMGKLVHYAVFSERHSNGQDWHYFFAEHKFPDIRSLLRYHMENGLDPQVAQRGEGRRDFDIQRNLRSSRKEAILSHVSLKYPRRPQPAKASDIF